MILVLDESASIDRTRFTQLLEYVTNNVSVIDVGGNRTRVGVMGYATEPRIIYKLNQRQTKDAVRDVIKFPVVRSERISNSKLLKRHSKA